MAHCEINLINEDLIMALVENFTSRNGNKVANQFKLFLAHGTVFQSYTSLIATKLYDGRVYLSDKWDYSPTTLKYLKDYLNTDASAKIIRERITSGEYQLIDEAQIEHLAVTGETF
ncbi:hypothetical protein ACQ38_gp05 [Proteus phage PM 93]|uniref:DUF8033 domain-containing protein n=1 Tax=Proteus phage PM 93 TaxID=1560284 RepID=A0A0U2ZT22_9CAUD|nr:hypothetical protein ACQ38_gp05 [Proteus phage PM 93]ALS88291.1 hypothetical protein PM93_005 [Proteus phage PM 93]